jgi:hypothetical protein
MARDFPELHAARRLHEEDGPLRLEVEGRLLARQGPEEIAGLTRLPVEVVKTYELCFYNVTDRLTARDWIALRAIGWWSFDPAEGRDRATIFRAFSYWGGPLILEAVRPYLADEQGLERLLAQAEAEEAFRERSIRLAILCNLLPWDEKTYKILLRMGLSLHEMAKTGSFTRSMQPIVALSVDETLVACAGHALLTVGRPSSPRTGTDAKPTFRKTG